MQLTVTRTRVDRMTDRYVLKFPKYSERFVCFNVKDWEAFCPEIKLGRGESVTNEFVLKIVHTELPSATANVEGSTPGTSVDILKG